MNSDISNAGLIWAHGGNIAIYGAVTGTGSALIDGAATLEFAAASSANVTFTGNDFGTLVLDNPTAYAGQIFGFTGADPQHSDLIDLKGINFDTGTSWTYYDNAGSGTGGTLTVFDTTNGVTTTVDSISFANGDYTTANFILTSDGHGGTLIADPPADSSTATVDTGAHLATSDSFVFNGSASANTLTSGSGGNNTTTTTIGGGGGDTPTGGGNGDTFVFNAIAAAQPGGGHFDTINDFNHGADHIDLAAINGLNSNNQAVNFNLLVSTPTAIAAHTVDIVTNGGNTVIYANASGTVQNIASVDVEIHLTNVINVTSADFIIHH